MKNLRRVGWCGVIVGSVSLISCATTAEETTSKRQKAVKTDVDQDVSINPEAVRNDALSETTAEDQGNSREDIEITAKIRRALVSEDSLSTSAQNIKVITNNRKVVLKGEVVSENEKRMVIDIAQNVAGATNVKNQLAVSARQKAD